MEYPKVIIEKLKESNVVIIDPKKLVKLESCIGGIGERGKTIYAAFIPKQLDTTELNEHSIVLSGDYDWKIGTNGPYLLLIPLKKSI